jgi:hypothetical protein
MTSSINPASELAKYVDAYATPRYGAKPRAAKQVRSPEIDMFEADSTYLDVSCGRGEALKHVLSLGKNITVRGTEMVPALCNDFVQQARLPELEGVEGADFVTCYEILEHLPTHDVLPAIDRLFELSRKMLVISTNDMPSMAKPLSGPDLPLHLSRFPQRWWLEQFEMRCMKRAAEGKGGRLYFRPLRKHVERPDGPRRFWVIYVDFREPYQPFDFGKCGYHGYDSDMTEFWFWYCPTFPVAEIKEMPASTQMELPHVKALHADLDARGILNPLLLHNMPGQPTRRYWTRTGNHRRNWALARGLKTVPAIVYGGCEFEPCEPMTLRQAQRKLRDGRISFVANQPPDVIDVAPWDTTMRFDHL